MFVLLSVKKSEYEHKLDEARVNLEVEKFLAARSSDLEEKIASHEEQKASIDIVKRALDSVKWDYLAVDAEGAAREIYLAGKKPDLVIALGGDGTVLRTAQYLMDERILGIRTDKRSLGYLCGIKSPDSARRAFEEIENLPVNRLTRLEFSIDGKVISNPHFSGAYSLPWMALNEGILCHKIPFINSQYEIMLDGIARKYKALGLVMATAAGSTAIMDTAGGEKMDLSDKRIQYIPIFKKGEKSKYAEELVVKSYTTDAKLQADGSREMIDVPYGATLKAYRGKELSLLGRIRD